MGVPCSVLEVADRGVIREGIFIVCVYVWVCVVCIERANLAVDGK